MRLTLSILKSEVYNSIKYKEKIVTNWLFLLLILIIECSVYFGLLGEFSTEILLYLLLSLCLGACLLTHRVPKFVNLIKRGEISKYFVYPKDIWLVVVIEDFSESLVLFLENIILVIPIFFMGYDVLSYLLFVASVFLAILLAVVTCELFFTLTLAVHNYSASKALISGISSFLSGGVIPLVLLPAWFVNLCYMTPFSMMVDGPVSVLTECNYSVIPMQIIWIVVTSVLSKIFFSVSIKSVDIYGG